jgi:hypothetical protein
LSFFFFSIFLLKNEKQNRLEILVVRFKAETKRTTNKQKVKENKKIQRQQSQVNYYTKKEQSIAIQILSLKQEKTKQIQERLKTDLAV